MTREVYHAIRTVKSQALDIFQPTIRLGVTGLSRAGKTVFITSLIHNLIEGKNLPLFKAQYEGRIAKVYLQPQPDDDIPRFSYEKHIEDLMDKRSWPDSTRQISQLRLTIEYETNKKWHKIFAPQKLNLDIIDYPGEWLLDLPLLSQDFHIFSQNAFELAQGHLRSDLSSDWLALASKIDPDAPINETQIGQLAEKFTRYLCACKHDKRALSALAPGRFLLPGELEGSPALTFSPLAHIKGKTAKPNTILAAMQRRYESYKSKVIRPFYQNHFARLDRQIILVDALQALNTGAEAIIDMERVLGDILLSFRIGQHAFPFNLFSHRIDKILIAATKADHLHHKNHEHLQNIVNHLFHRAQKHLDMSGHISGVDISILAIAAVRATTEAIYQHDHETLPLIIGTPQKGETINGEIFDGNTKKAIFPGDLPEKPESFFKQPDSTSEPLNSESGYINFMHLRPPEWPRHHTGSSSDIPHIRLDKALEFLLGDKLQ